MQQSAGSGSNSAPNLDEFRTWMAEWDKAASTIRGYEATVRIFARWFKERNGEDFAPISVTPLDVKDYRDGMIGQKRSPNTINYHLSALSTYFLWAQEAGIIEANPTSRIKQVPIQKGAPRWMDRREENALARALQKELQVAVVRARGEARHPGIVREKRNTAIVMLMLNAGLRVSEVVDLAVSDVELNERSGHVVVRDSKKKKHRQVPLNADARRAIQDWLDVRPGRDGDRDGDRDRVFVGHGRSSKRLTTRSVHRLVQKYSRLAGLAEEGVSVSPHTLRHTCGHNLVEAGVALDRVAAILGHEKLDTTAVYTMPSDKELQREVERIARE